MENAGKYSELTGSILACAIEVHKELGFGSLSASFGNRNE